MRTILFLGYYEKKEGHTDFCYVNDKTLIERMEKLRGDRYLLCDWNDLGLDLTSKNAYDYGSKKEVSCSLKDIDAVVFLATPTKVSTHTNYHRSIALLEKMASENIPGVNPPSSILEFDDKSYFMRYPSLPFPKTFLGENGFESHLGELGERVIVKPIDTDGGYCVNNLPNDFSAIQDFLDRNQKDAPFIIQEFVPEISEGERSLYFFDKKFRYAMIKRPRKGEFRSNWRYVDHLGPYTPTNEELGVATNAIEAVSSKSVIERIDMVSSRRIIELTLDCPGFYLEEAGVDDKIGTWMYESIDSVLRR